MILRDRCSASYDPFTTILRLLSAPVVLGNLFLGTLLGNLFLGTRYPTLRRADLAAPRDSLGKGDPSPEPGFQRIWLLRPAPEPLLWLKTRSLRCWGKMFQTTNQFNIRVMGLLISPNVWGRYLGHGSPVQRAQLHLCIHLICLARIAHDMS